MVLLDESFEAISIHEAEREDALAELEAPGLKARNERGMLSVSKFTAIGCVARERDGGSPDEEGPWSSLRVNGSDSTGTRDHRSERLPGCGPATPLSRALLAVQRP